MGQTLTNGVYLPDEGERNCYAGLAANWNILDGAVGTVADHTTALAGKAPLVHTHTKSDITDFPAYGNAAGTICEGNDSRLSDARTPVAHTHGNISNDGKLTNGNRAVITGSDKAIIESSVTDTELSYLSGVTSAIQTQLNAKAADSDVVHKNGNESIAGVKAFLNTNIRFNASSYVSGTPSDNIFYAPILIGGVVNNTDKNTFQHNAAIRTTGINDYSIRVYSQTSNTLTGVVAETNADASNISFRPIANGTHNLGTSSYPWKTINGINPGALSLPKNSYNSSYNIDTTNWATDGTIISYTPLLDGWLYINAKNDDTNGDSFIIFDDGVSSFGSGVFGNKGLANNNVGLLCLMMPVNANNGVNIRIKSPGIVSARLYPCNGNV